MTTLTFQNKTLSVINQHNQTYITASDLGNALKYSHPIQNVTKIYKRNADEFTAEMTALIEMPTAWPTKSPYFLASWCTPDCHVRPHQSCQRLPQMGTRYFRS